MSPSRKYQTALARPINPPTEAAGVTYFDMGAGFKSFRCEPLRANLTQTGCGARWREAQDATGHTAERMAVCRSCPIGAAHAGEEFVHYSRLYGASICPRCRRGASRMIFNRRCVSCYNRGRELRAGRNARGNRPVELMQAPLHAVEFLTIVNGRAQRTRVPGVVDLFEPMVQTLRTTKGEVAFAFAGSTVLKQGRLF